ncbi:MAG TPA: methyltetrahydrofolate--corrinoid methyltransferase [Coriobacteriia bacterium]|nr:methyltetrahydrofolate--corrinoid methyltransferase [Coriobacteriia bacterium]
MIIIGEKINGFIKKTMEAIEAKDEAYLKELAQKQTDCGAAYIDICAGTMPDVERQTMEWLIGLVQDTVDTPISLDSSDPQVIVDMMPLVKRPGLINSVSKEAGKTETVFPAIKGTDWKVVALTCDSEGIPDAAADKYKIGKQIIEEAAEYGIGLDRIFIDPCVTTLGTRQDCLVEFIGAMKLLRADYPDVQFTSGLSNISFGMPFRKAINMQFLSLAMYEGMDSAIIDPISPDMQAVMHAVDALMGKDEYCMNYLSAFREGKFGK